MDSGPGGWSPNRARKSDNTDTAMGGSITECMNRR